ncbi:MAG: DUF2938 domain-containing protein [Phreatobacter sp.]|uniref:DUF2938 domain-containing protein n=1 Tax=Phreatobacter sp. TaxID=1966341 RepID=UPI002733570F|nr:DUF2938 domain-containing protein [Phreatobacter sp.]MDP2801967.1 DUF2938 domain-containing protein [Phreatobacter sp.]
MFEFIWRSIVIGVAATALLDLWALFLQRVFAVAPPNWAMVGRWVGHLPQGRFIHDDIGRSAPVSNERVIGWIFHYAVGIAFAAVLLAVWGLGWARVPTLVPALIVGYVTIGCGWFILQPGMGAGIAASRRDNAMQIRMLNILGHTVFGLGLYFAALLTR